MSSAKSSPTVAAVVVTYNRLALLKECVAALRAQTRPVDEIIVVNNGSTDGTAEWLAGEPGLTVVTQANQGSSGGQATGAATAFRAGHDWFWLMDDDTVPRPGALKELCESRPFADPKTGFLSPLAVWTDGTPHRMNIQPPRPPDEWYHTVLADGCVPVEWASFVALLVRRDAVATVGLPLRPMFIWYDDLEFTRRVLTRYTGYAVLGSVVDHKTPRNAGTTVDRVARADLMKFRYGVRNQTYLHRTAPRPLARRALTTARYLASQAALVLRSRAPVGLFWAALTGLWFRPRVEFP